MKALLIDPIDQTVETIHGDFDNFREIQKTIRCSVFTVAGYIEGNCVYVDDEGLLKANLWFTVMPHYPQPLAGRIVIVGSTDDGDNTDVTISAEVLQDQVQFLNIFQVRKLYA